MSRSPQDVYARYLLSSRGYPLWIPEPSHELLLSRPDGLRIGDVGVVVPEDGGFEVFFNICLPHDHPFHRATGVPDNFKLVELNDGDIRIIPRVENPGRIISSSSVTRVRTVDPPSDAAGAQSVGLGYDFDLSSNGGALLILPEGAERHDLRNHRLFFEEATRHGVDWYRFAEERLGRMISHDSLYLITGFYKTGSWSLAAFENVAGSGHFSAQFKIAQTGGSNIAGSYTWETTRALDWRVGPEDNNGFANQSVFVRGFKVALRTGFLGKKRIEVKADAPSTSSEHGGFSPVVKRDLGISHSWKGLSKGGRAATDPRDDDVVTGPVTDHARDHLLSCGPAADEETHVVIQPVPGLSEMFHPSDIINQYLLEKAPSANVAITHDDDWITILEKGELKPEDFFHVNSSQAEAIVANYFHVVSQEGVVFLHGKCDATTINDPTAFPPVETWGGRGVQDENFSSVLEEEDPPPAYGVDCPGFHESTDVSAKSHLLPKPPVPAFRQPLGIHWLLLPFNPRTSKHLLRFDVMFPVDRICYQYGSIRERLTGEDLDEPGSDVPITKMRVAFEQRPFSWTIYIDNQNGIRCRDVFEAIYDSFNRQLTLGELWRVPNRAACEEAFRIRTLVLRSPQTERSLGWKRVDVLLHHTIFHGLTMNSEGDWVLNLGAPLPVPNLPWFLSLSRRNSSSTAEESAESSDESTELSQSPTPPHRDLSSTEAANAKSSTSHTSFPVISSAVELTHEVVRSRPSRPVGPRQRPNGIR